MSNISLQMYTMRDYTKDKQQLADTLEKLAKIGYKNVQITIPGYLTATELKGMLDANGLKADSFYAAGSTMDNNIGKIVETAETLGTCVIRTDAISYEDSMSIDGFKRYASLINGRGKLLRENGLTFVYHFHAYEYVNFDTCTGMDLLLSETSPEYIHFQPDVHWMAAAGVEPSQDLYRFEGRAEYIHMQGYAIIPIPGKKEHVDRRTVPVGTGNLNWKGIIKTARDIGIKMFVVEQDDCLIDPFDSVKSSFENLNKLGVY